MDMIEWLTRFLDTDNSKLIYILSLILGANILDFTVGWLNARFNPKVDFSSSRAIFGIARKLLLFILLVYAIPVALLVPDPLGISALYVLYFGYLASEVNSILHHFRIVDDDKTTDLFIDFFKTIFEKKGGK